MEYAELLSAISKRDPNLAGYLQRPDVNVGATYRLRKAGILRDLRKALETGNEDQIQTTMRELRPQVERMLQAGKTGASDSPLPEKMRLEDSFRYLEQEILRLRSTGEMSISASLDGPVLQAEFDAVLTDNFRRNNTVVSAIFRCWRKFWKAGLDLVPHSNALPQAQKDGSFIWQEKRYGHKKYWSDRFEKQMNMDEGVISILLHGQEGTTAFTHGGTMREQAFFSENQVIDLIEAIPTTQEERHIVHNEKDHWTVSFDLDSYRARFEFQYEEIVIAKAPSGRIRMYYLDEGIQRVLGYSPRENAIRREQDKEERRIAPEMNSWRITIKSRLRWLKREDNEAANVEDIIAALRREYPKSEDFMELKYGRLRQIGFRHWKNLAPVFGYTGDIQKDVALRLYIARRVYGEDDAFLVEYWQQLEEMLKEPEEELGEISIGWSQTIRNLFQSSQEWFTHSVNAHSPPLHTIINNFARRLGYSAYRLKHPEVRIIIGFRLFGNDDAYLNSLKQQYPAMALLKPKIIHKPRIMEDGDSPFF